MKPRLLVLGCALTLLSLPANADKLRVGWCNRSLNPSAAPFAVAVKMGWFAKDGIDLDLIPLAGSTECVKFVATRDVAYALAAPEPLALIRSQGVKAKIYYTAYQGFIYGIAVPVGSPVKGFAELKGKVVGVTAMGSVGVTVAKAQVASAGLDPERDIRLVVAGEGAQAAQLLRTNQVDALSEFDTQYAMVETTGMKLRRLPSPELAHFPSNGFVALEETLKVNRKQAIALAQGYARGTLFALANPEAAVRILWEVYPQTRPTGKDEATALRDDLLTLQARLEHVKLAKSGATQWGQSVEASYTAYLDFLQKWGLTKERATAADVTTNALIPEINAFDAAAPAAAAKAWKVR